MNQKALELLLGDMVNTPRDMGAGGHKPDSRAASFALSYLDAFGYLKNELAEWKDISLQDIKLALGDLQTSLGLTKTRALTIQTVRAMEAPRCGCPDVIRPRHKCQKAIQKKAEKRKRLWQTTGLTYAVIANPSTLKTADFERAVESGFAAWTTHAKLEAYQVDDPEKADVVIGVGQGPQSNFDGPGGTLAWAVSRDTQSFIKLDDDEVWTMDPRERGFCIHNVMRHEIGHVLGLQHSMNAPDLMSPFYNAAVGRPQVNDVMKLQLKYGAKEQQSVTKLLTVPVKLVDAVAAVTAAGFTVTEGWG